MPYRSFTMWNQWRYDLPASLVVFLVALPLCLGIALASGAPLFAGLISGVVGGVVVSSISRASLSVSGPAAGLTVIVLAAIQDLPSYEIFLAAVVLAGLLQIIMGICKAGIIGHFIPSSVIKGMLAAIGLILILKQIPHAVGYDVHPEGVSSFWHHDGSNTFSSLLHMLSYMSPAATGIAFVSVVFLFWWDKFQPTCTNIFRYLPGPLVIVLFGAMVNGLLIAYAPGYALSAEHLVSVPVSRSLQEFSQHLHFPDFSQWQNETLWAVAITLALVASVETLLSIEAVDKLDPYKRVTPTNRELVAQGIGNIVSGMLGGLPITSVIVRSSANITAGGRTRLSAFSHGWLLLVSVISIPKLLNLIPLASLAAVLIVVGYKLTRPAIFRDKWVKGPTHIVPFVVTITAILLTDLLVGIAIGVLVGIIFVIQQNFRSALTLTQDGKNYLLRAKKDLFFIHKYELKSLLDTIPDSSNLLIDLTRANYIDLDNVEILQDYIGVCKSRSIRARFKQNPEAKTNPFLNELYNAAS